LVSLWGKNLQDFIKQGNETRFFEGRKVICPLGGAVQVFVTLGFLNMPKGVWFGANYWFEAYDNPYNEKFVNLYMSLSRFQIPPSFASHNGYVAVKMFKAAVEKARSTDREAVANALSGLTVTDLPGGPMTFRAEDHQAVYDVAFGRTAAKPAKGTKIIRGLDPIMFFPGNEITPAPSSECKMRNLRGSSRPAEEKRTTEKSRVGKEDPK
jgi:branched-chain amino acid transport system substrate-binding protein